MDSEMAKRPEIADDRTSMPHEESHRNPVDGGAGTAESSPDCLSVNTGESTDEKTGQNVLRANDALLSRLSIEEAIKLNEVLSNYPGSVFSNIESIDGILTAIAISPDRRAVGVYLDAVLIELAKGALSEYTDIPREFEFRILALRYLQNLWRILYDENQKYEPVLQENENRGRDWASGFISQVDRGKLYWGNLVSMNDRLWRHYVGICELCLGVEVDEDVKVDYANPGHGSKSELSPEQRERNIGNIGTAVEQFSEAELEAMKLYMRDLKDMEDSRVEQVKRTTGRNYPCPCGSGKKFKRCCGQ